MNLTPTTYHEFMAGAAAYRDFAAENSANLGGTKGYDLQSYRRDAWTRRSYAEHLASLPFSQQVEFGMLAA